jgi:cytochrome c-type biogenesis protein CcmH
MILFWVVAGVFSAAAAGLILFRAARAASQPEAADPTPVLYRRQLAEIDDLAERGLIAEPERKSAHAEAARRLLAAAEKPGEAWIAAPAARRPIVWAVIAAPALALGLYLALGAKGLPDQPFAKRLEGWKAAGPERLQPDELAAVLERVARDRPNDPELLRYVGMAENAAQNPAAAVRALHKAVKVAPERADLWTALGESLAFRDGAVSDEAVDAFKESLRRDPSGVSARYYLARAQVDRGDKPAGLAIWRALLAELPAGDERRAILLQSIAQAEAQPSGPSSVSGEQLAAIRGMVAGLAERLKSNPDDPEGWVRLVRAYAVLNESAQRDATLKTAKARYAARPDVLNQLAQAAAAEPMK